MESCFLYLHLKKIGISNGKVQYIPISKPNWYFFTRCFRKDEWVKIYPVISKISMLLAPQWGWLISTWQMNWDTPWWRHLMETFSILLAICAGNSLVTSEFPTQRPVTRSFDVFFDLHLNKRLSKQSWGWWFKLPSRPLWRHCNDMGGITMSYLVLSENEG